MTEIKRMPSKEELEAFLAGFHGSPTVVFNRTTGQFEKLGDPKTEWGASLRTKGWSSKEIEDLMKEKL